ncbi:serine protease, S1-C subfamily, contains C-terminal PDZ domain [Nannocystis exedens]|uniref:Serine protease, S1-C subfamily, contains C-terminal PDZ domain n=1 Tax=Nannocystis exedens TaxID=54 RepID=A0A1I1WBS0_9BACT|nr:trypsin-like peptidase domain-containing protein [Nannocystis exedens]PCC67603.1 putative serine protease HhoA precursor [Nannocystis exedens]SFD92645.1 serine protease, S1-C subfamily, contains C-terminal PDZ domain [Nannocystis exedens]
MTLTWRESLERVCAAVVSVRIDAPRPFDTEWNGSSQATAFVVDAEQGLLLSNRHVVQPGPVVAEAVFLNHEEIPLRPVYRDPVHDFGFFRYDPAALRFIRPPALRLRPDKALVGTELRVVGNDAGEKLSILAGTLARVDRPAPLYGSSKYNDFNTFYLQAASGATGGSSGSPVVDIEGDVIALNAGSRTQAASSFFLPLERVLRAFELLRAGQPIPRGTLMTTFSYTPFDELARLGLRPETEQACRAADPGGIGLLIVDKLIPGGVTDGLLEPGDILLRVDGEFIPRFVPLEAHLDASVGQTITLELERGGRPLTVRARVHDLHAITPSTYLEVGGAILHDLSYQRARNPQVPLTGVYLANSGYLFAPLDLDRGAVVRAIAGVPTPDLAAAEAVLGSLPHGAPFMVRWVDLDQPTREHVTVVTMDRRWFAMTRSTRDDASGRWPSTDGPPPPPPPTRTPVTTNLPPSDDVRVQQVQPSLVTVTCNIPYKIDGIHATRFVGAGLVVDARRGLVLVDRNTVPIALADITLTVAGAVEIPGEIAFLHPHHNYAIVSYDPALLGDTPIRAVDLAPRPLHPGDPVWLVGLKSGHRVFAQSTAVAAVEAVDLPLPRPPRFRAMNLERISLTSATASLGGAIVDSEARVLALWAGFSYQDGKDHRVAEYGIAADLFAEAVEIFRRGESPIVCDLGVEFGTVTLAEARHRGLSPETAAELEGHDPLRRQVLVVQRLAAFARGWQAGDLVLRAGGATVTSVREIERSLRGGRVTVHLLRDGRELELEVETRPDDGRGTDRVLHWAGALLQAPHHAALIQRAVPDEGVYISLYWYGSPASRSRLRAARRIVAAEDRPTPDIDSFLAAVAGKPDRASVRLKTVDLDGKVDLLTLRLDLEYFPTYELRRTRDGWIRIEHS